MVEIDREGPKEGRPDQLPQDGVELRIVGLLQLLHVALGVVGDLAGGLLMHHVTAGAGVAVAGEELGHSWRRDLLGIRRMRRAEEGRGGGQEEEARQGDRSPARRNRRRRHW